MADEKNTHIDEPVADLRNRIDVTTRFKQSALGYDRQQVNDYIVELTANYQKLSEDDRKLINDLQQQLAFAQAQYEAAAEHQDKLQQQLNERERQLAERERLLAEQQGKLSEQLDEAKRRLQEAAGHEQNQLREMRELATAVIDKNALLEQAEQQIAQLRQSMAAAEKLDAGRGYEQLEKENLKLKAAVDMSRCEMESFKELLAKAQAQNAELSDRQALSDSRFVEQKLRLQRDINNVRNFHSTSVTAMLAQFEGCIRFLHKYSNDFSAYLDGIVAGNFTDNAAPPPERDGDAAANEE
ncbi:MAG: hypothetical protein Q4B96_07060 [Bacillota bacterium]|nr:hypothetical protein [Bacillota bacterium]